MTLADHRETIQEIQLHGFGDLSGYGVGAVVYAVVKQESGITQRLVAAKARLVKQGLTISRLELICFNWNCQSSSTGLISLEKKYINQLN